MNNRIIPSLAFIAAIGIFFIYISPAWTGSIATTKASIASDVKALAAAGEYASQQKSLAKAKADISPEDLKRLEVFLPDSVDNVGLVLDMNALAARSGLSLSNIDVAKVAETSASAGSPAPKSTAGASPSSATNSVGSVDISLSAVGTYTALQTFLVGVERSQRLLDIQDISVTGSDTGVYTYQMKMRIYWLR